MKNALSRVRRTAWFRRRPERILFYCPDENTTLRLNRMETEGTGGGKSSVLRLAGALARAGCEVTLACPRIDPARAGRLRLVALSQAPGRYDVAVYVTAVAGHFGQDAIHGIAARCRVFWINGPARVECPPGEIDLYVAPARFLARTAIDEWGYPADRVVVVPGEAVARRWDSATPLPRDPFSIVYASHPFKGLREAVDVVGRLRRRFPMVTLDVFGSEHLWFDDSDRSVDASGLPEWVRVRGTVPKAEIESRMRRYGLMLYLTEWVDAFSSATADALAAGVVTIAAAHGSNAEFLRHGWNGLLVGSREGKPDLDQAENLAGIYLADPAAFGSLRRRAMRSVPTWDEQAIAWRELWRARLET